MILLDVGIESPVLIYNRTFPTAWTKPLSLAIEKELTDPIEAVYVAVDC
jgi:hypothetical protein